MRDVYRRKFNKMKEQDTYHYVKKKARSVLNMSDGELIKELSGLKTMLAFSNSPEFTGRYDEVIKEIDNRKIRDKIITA